MIRCCFKLGVSLVALFQKSLIPFISKHHILFSLLLLYYLDWESFIYIQSLCKIVNHPFNE